MKQIPIRDAYSRGLLTLGRKIRSNGDGISPDIQGYIGELGIGCFYFWHQKSTNHGGRGNTHPPSGWHSWQINYNDPGFVILQEDFNFQDNSYVIINQKDKEIQECVFTPVELSEKLAEADYPFEIYQLKKVDLKLKLEEI